MVAKFEGKSWLDVEGVKKAVRQASVDPFVKAATIVRNEAVRSMKKGGRIRERGTGGQFVKSTRGEPSEAPNPPHAQTATLRNSIKIERTKKGTYLVGPTTRAFYGVVHEFGAVIKVTPKMRGFLHFIGIHLKPSTKVIHIPPRPFMRPALFRALNKFPDLFKNLKLGQTRAGRALNRALNRNRAR